MTLNKVMRTAGCALALALLAGSMPAQAAGRATTPQVLKAPLHAPGPKSFGQRSDGGSPQAAPTGPSQKDIDKFAAACKDRGGGASIEPHATGSGFSMRCRDSDGNVMVSEGPFYPD
ncbi:MAG: hypothetical protein ACFB13_05915 [Kiloniellaceae bacterium]